MGGLGGQVWARAFCFAVRAGAGHEAPPSAVARGGADAAPRPACVGSCHQRALIQQPIRAKADRQPAPLTVRNNVLCVSTMSYIAPMVR